jgi:hypothetical protein
MNLTPAMNSSPYDGLGSTAFWRLGVAKENPYSINEIYKNKFAIESHTRIATAGSCFAQNISRILKQNGYSVIDEEKAPTCLPSSLHQKYGYSMYSARYGNIYTVRQLLQLVNEVDGSWAPQNWIWEKDGKFFDALRPAVEPEGHDTPEEVMEHRKYHISKVRSVFKRMDLFIFTLGLTETWVHNESGTVYPTAPGVLCGKYNKDSFRLEQAFHKDIMSDFVKCQTALTSIRKDQKPFGILLTVSPVPLTATASGRHVLVANTCAKSTLRSAAGQLAAEYDHIDYFPSYEIVTNPRLHSTSFSDNLRSIRPEAAENAMRHFMLAHSMKSQQCAVSGVESSIAAPSDDDIECEDALLDLVI